MRIQQLISGLLAALSVIVAASCSKSKSVQPVNPQPDTSKISTVSAYLTKAQETHAFIASNLLTTNSSYRVNTSSSTGTAYEWYNVSQIYADAAMVKAGQTSYLSTMNNTYNWMSHLWDINNANGGYFAAANIDGTGAGGAKYADDNSLTGMI